MTDKVRITMDRVVSRSKGKVKYYADDGSIVTNSTKVVSVYDTQEELDAAVLEEGQRENEEAQQAAEADAAADESTPTDEQAAEDTAQTATPASSNKRGKGKRKEQMATKKKAAGKKAAVKKTSSGALIRTVAGREHDISGYEKVKNASGHTSYDNGDDVATKLRGKTLDEVYAHAAKVLKEPEKELRKKYEHLNAGMQRMSLGNRLRKVVAAKAAA